VLVAVLVAVLVTRPATSQLLAVLVAVLVTRPATSQKACNKDLFNNSYMYNIIYRIYNKCTVCIIMQTNPESRIANCESRIANCELRIANCELRISNHGTSLSRRARTRGLHLSLLMKPAVLAVDEDLRALEEDGAMAKGRPCRRDTVAPSTAYATR
jgi:hypothetical protein